MNFSQRLKKIRNSIHLTQAELAERMMVSVQTISKWECSHAMPDIGQIVPLASILGVTTDWLLGAGNDENNDRTALQEKVQRIKKGIDNIYKGIDNIYARNDNAYMEIFQLYKDYIQQYPMDYEAKFHCADILLRFLYYGDVSSEEKNRFFEEAKILLRSVIDFDRNMARVMDAKQTLIMLYLYHQDFKHAEEVLEELPERGSIRDIMAIEVHAMKNEREKCVEIANRVLDEAAHHYFHALALKAKRISVLGITTKKNAIQAWKQLLRAIENHDAIKWDIQIHKKWLYSAYNHIFQDYMSLSETEEAFWILEKLTNTLLEDYNRCRSMGKIDTAEEIRENFCFYLRGCLPEDEKQMILKDERYITCENRLRYVPNQQGQ